MKTSTYLPTLLAISIQLMLCGQNQETHARKIRADIMGNKTVKETTTTVLQTKSSETLTDNLETQANILKSNKEQLANQINELQNKAILVEIEIANYQTSINTKTYNSNKQLFSQLYSEIKTETPKTKKALTLNESANRFMMIALEMIEEANAQLTNFAKYGELSNANQNEYDAIAKQIEAIDLLKKEMNFKPIEITNNRNADKNIGFKAIQQTIKITSSSIKNDTENLSLLINDAENLKKTISEIRLVAVTKNKEEQNVMKEEANSLEQDYFKKKIDISTYEAQVLYQVYNLNKETIQSLLNELNIHSQNYKKANQLILEAERSIRIGKEMREEAKAQISLAASYGEMTNAKEIEELAIQKQNEAKKIVTKISAVQTLVMN